MISGCCRDLPPQGDALTAGGLCGGGLQRILPNTKVQSTLHLAGEPWLHPYLLRTDTRYVKVWVTQRVRSTKYSYEYVRICCMGRTRCRALNSQGPRVFDQRPTGQSRRLSEPLVKSKSFSSNVRVMLDYSYSARRTRWACGNTKAVNPPQIQAANSLFVSPHVCPREAIIRVDNFVAHCPRLGRYPGNC